MGAITGMARSYPIKSILSQHSLDRYRCPFSGIGIYDQEVKKLSDNLA